MNKEIYQKLMILRTCGIISVALTVIAIPLDFLVVSKPTTIFLALNIIIAVIGVVMASLFTYAFVILGKLYNKRLASLSWGLIIMGAITTVVGNVAIYAHAKVVENLAIISVAGLITGVLLILIGIEERKMVNQIGNLARPAGNINITAGILMATIVLSSIGGILSIVSNIYLIVLLKRLSSKIA